MIRAATAAPTSGRRITRADHEVVAIRSSAVAVAAVIRSPGSGGSELLDLCSVVLGHKTRTGVDRLGAGHIVAITHLEREKDDGQVPLQVRLLIHGKSYVAGQDCGNDVAGHVERGNLRLAVRILLSRDRSLGNGWIQGKDAVDARVGEQLGLD